METEDLVKAAQHLNELVRKFNTNPANDILPLLAIGFFGGDVALIYGTNQEIYKIFNSSAAMIKYLQENSK